MILLFILNCVILDINKKCEKSFVLSSVFLIEKIVFLIHRTFSNKGYVRNKPISLSGRHLIICLANDFSSKYINFFK